jgi:hypothetical protein
MNKYAAILVFICGVALNACNPFAIGMPNSEKITTAGWADAPPKEAPTPLYCYRTLGETTCYKTPQKEKTERFVGSYEDYQKSKKEWYDNFWG